MEKDELKSYLSRFCGTEHWYKHWMGLITYTDGVKALAEKAGAYWLIDAVASYQVREDIRRCPAQFWLLKTDLEEGSAVLTMREDSNRPILVRQEIDCTDFPLEEQEVWLFDKVLILPSEY